MKKIRSTTFVVPVLIVLGIAASVQPVSASVETECRQEADDYGIAPELRDEYIKGCVDSRGGEITPSSVEQDYVPASEPGDTGNSGGDSNNVIDSHGGESAPSSVEQDYVPASESEDTGNSEADSKNVAE